MCVAKWFAGSNNGAEAQLALANQQQQQAQASIASANLDTEASRSAAEAAMRKAAASQGFSSTFGAGSSAPPTNVAYKALFGA